MCTLDTIKTICEVLAYIFAAIFFAFKAYSGAFYVSLALSLNLERKALNNSQDQLVVDLKLIGGENAILDIHKIYGRITYDKQKEYFSFDDVDRLVIKQIDSELKLDSDSDKSWKIQAGDKYRISVKDETSFCSVVTIPNNAICKVDVVVIGSRKKKPSKPTISQWRISKISLPK